MIDFSLEPEFEAKLAWIRKFVAEEVEPLDVKFNFNVNAPYDVTNKGMMRALKHLQAQVRAQGLWAPHLDPELGGQGYGQAKLCFINEILGRSFFAPRVFGAQAPDSGNSEILARYGSARQKARFLKPLLDGDIISCYSMTEPDGGADPGSFVTNAVHAGDEWIINGEKWFSSNLRYAAFAILMVVTNPGAPLHERFSMFLVPTDTPGIKIKRNVGLWGETDEESTHGYVHYDNVRVPADALLGKENGGWEVAQSRLGGGRIHHAMRSIGLCQRALDMACERVISRQTKGKRLADLGVVQDDIGRCWIQLQQFKWFVLHTSWLYDQGKRDEAWIATAGVKAATADVLHDIIWRCMHLHGSWGVSNELPFASMIHTAAAVSVVDGPTESHRSLVARTLLKQYQPVDSRQPSEHIPTRRAWAERKLAPFFGDPNEQ